MAFLEKSCPLISMPDHSLEYHYEKIGIANSELKINLAHLRNWTKKQKYIPLRISNNFLENYLVRCGNDVKKCQQKLEAYFKSKMLYPEYLMPGDLKDPQFGDFCSKIYSVYMPKLTEEGHRVFIDKVTLDENLFDVRKIFQYFCMQTEIRFLEDKYDAGDIILFDCNNIALTNFITFVPFFMKSLSILIEVFPINIKLMVIINTGYIMSFTINAIRAFLNDNIKKKLYIYADGYRNFYNHVTGDVLPEEYGGFQPSLREIRDLWLSSLERNNSWFTNQQKLQIILTSSYSCDCEELYSLGGTFKNLSLD